MLIGYALQPDETSLNDDDVLAHQLDALIDAGVDEENIYSDSSAPNNILRPELEFCLRALREGDVLVVLRLERLCRSMGELVEIVEKLKAKKVDLRSIVEGVDTSTPEGKSFFHAFSAVAQFERDIISDRTKAGLRAAAARGRRGGRKPKISSAQVRVIREMMENTNLNHDEIAENFGVARATLYRALERDDKEKEERENKQRSEAENDAELERERKRTEFAKKFDDLLK